MLVQSPPNSASDARTVQTLVQAWYPLLFALLLAPFANGVHTVAAAGWLFPLCLLRFVRVQPRAVGLPIAYALLTGAFALSVLENVPDARRSICRTLLRLGLSSSLELLIYFGARAIWEGSFASLPTSL